MLQRAAFPPSATMPATTGPVPYTPPTAAFGNGDEGSRNIRRKPVPWLSIWKRQPYSVVVLPIIFLRGPSWVSDQPDDSEGVKTDKSDNMVTQNYVNEHVEIGIASLRMIIDEKKNCKTLKFDW